MSTRSKYPLELIERDFVTKRMRYCDLRLKYNISEALLAYHSKRLGWSKKRKENFGKIREKIIEKENISIAEDAVAEKSTLITRLTEILDLKVEVEQLALTKSLENKDLKTLRLILNKSKDNIGELTKTIRLLQGESTENFKDVTKEQKQAKLDRLSGYLHPTSALELT